MASGRIAYNKTSPLGIKIQQVMNQGIQYRQQVDELHRIIEKYNDDNAGIATDSGIDSGSVTLVRVLIAQSVGETAAVVLQDPSILKGDQTGTRQLLDAMG